MSVIALMIAQNVGIQDFGMCLPSRYLPIEVLAEKRNIEVAKLKLGLGLEEMAVCDKLEDVPYMAAKAIEDLVHAQLSKGVVGSSNEFFSQVDRIYLGTESAIDAAKPSITYALDILQKTFDCSFEHIDFLDMTFACIGGTDALHQCLDYVRLRPTRKCIVVAADKAIYDSNTGGEYTQGAGAVAFLVSASPELISFSGEVGVAVSHDFDFYKPKRYFEKSAIIQSLMSRLDMDISVLPEQKLAALIDTDTVLKAGTLEGWAADFWDLPGAFIPVQREEPVYDGQFSNACFEQRVSQALGDFLRKNNVDVLPETAHWIFHLPYAYQGRRMAVRIWWEQVVSQNASMRSALLTQLGDCDTTDEAAYGAWLKQLAKTDAYRNFVKESIAPTDAVSSKVGNLYTASIFMALLSGMAFSDGDLTEKQALFFAYGSGSKSKVFLGNYAKLVPREEIARRIHQHLERRVAIDYAEYERLRRK